MALELNSIEIRVRLREYSLSTRARLGQRLTECKSYTCVVIAPDLRDDLVLVSNFEKTQTQNSPVFGGWKGKWGGADINTIIHEGIRVFRTTSIN